MNIDAIKSRASEYLDEQTLGKFRNVILISSLIAIIPQLFQGRNAVLGFISGVLSILLIAVGHGVIVGALKIVTNRSETITSDDGLVGIQQARRLLPTYLVNELLQALIVAVVTFILTMGAFAVSYNAIEHLIAITKMPTVSTNTIASLTMELMDSGLLLYFLVVILVITIIAVFLSLNFFAVPYLLEQYGYTNLTAMKESYNLMKGHKFELFKLQFSYIGWYFLLGLVVGLIQSLVGHILPASLATVLATVVGVVFGAYTFVPKLEVAKAIFFEELAYYQYENINESE